MILAALLALLLIPTAIVHAEDGTPPETIPQETATPPAESPTETTQPDAEPADGSTAVEPPASPDPAADEPTAPAAECPPAADPAVESTPDDPLLPGEEPAAEGTDEGGTEEATEGTDTPAADDPVAPDAPAGCEPDAGAEVDEALPPEDAEPTDTVVDSGSTLPPEDAGSQTDDAAPVTLPDDPQPAADPYYMIAGRTYRFLPESGICGETPDCTVSETPIQAAIDSARNQPIDDGTIYIEGGIFNETIIIEDLGFDLTLLGGAANTGPTTINGAIVIRSASGTVTLSNLSFGVDTVISIAGTAQVTINGTPASDTIQVEIAGNEPFQAEVNGMAGDDTLAVSFSAGAPSGELAYDGGDDFDSLVIRNGNFQAGNFTARDPNSGSIALDGMHIDYTHIEPVDSYAVIDAFTFTGVSGNETITVAAGGIHTDALACPAGCQTLRIDSTGSEDTLIANARKVEIKGEGGSDTFNVSLTQFVTGLEELVIDGGGGTDTVNFTGNTLLNGGDLDVTAENITVNANVVISTRSLATSAEAVNVVAASIGNSGNITFTGNTITINTGAKLLAGVGGSAFTPGDITISAAAQYPTWLQVLLQALPIDPTINTATISISGATITGGDVEISADASEVTLYDDAGDYAASWASSLATLLDQVFGLVLSAAFGITGQVVIHASQATIALTNSSITAAGDVTIGTNAQADASHHTVAINGMRTSGAFTLAFSLGIANTTATTTLTNSTITAGGDVSISSFADSKAYVKARTSSNINNVNPNNSSVAVAVTVTNETSHVTVDGTSTITALGVVDIDASGSVYNFAWAQPTIYVDGVWAVAFALDVDNASIIARVDGTIDAWASNAAGSGGNTFDANGGMDVNYDLNRITIQDHGFFDGQMVSYSPGTMVLIPGAWAVDAPAVGGLCAAGSGCATGGYYYIQVIDGNTIQLSKAASLDIGYTPIDPTKDPQHTLGKVVQSAFEPAAVNTAAGTITFSAAHGLQTGDAIYYMGTTSRKDADGLELNQDVGGLTPHTQYYVIAINATTIQLAQTASGPAIPLTSAGIGTHALIYQTNLKTFSPVTDVLDSRNVIVFDNPHGFTTGDAVLYRTDPDGTLVRPAPPVRLDAGLTRVNDTTLTVAGDLSALLESGAASVVQIDGDNRDAVIATITYDSASNTTSVVFTAPVLTGSALTQVLVASPSTITIHDLALEGLEDFGIYYVVVVDDRTIRLAADSAGALAAAPIDLNVADGSWELFRGREHELSDADGSNGIRIHAGLTAVNPVNSNASLTGQRYGVSQFVTQGLGGGQMMTQAETWLSGLMLLASRFSAAQQPASTPAQSTDYGVAGSIAINYLFHDVAAIAGATSTLRSSGDILVQAEVTQATQIAVVSGASKPSSANADAVTSIAFGLGIYNNTVRATVEGGAELDAGGAVSVVSTLTYDFLMSSLRFWEYIEASGPEGYQYLQDGTLGLSCNLFNNFVTTSASGADVTRGGSLVIDIYNNTVEARIQNGARINQEADQWLATPRFRTGEQTVSVAASTAMNFIFIVGVASLGLNIDGIYGAWFGPEASGFTSGLAKIFNVFGAEGAKDSYGAALLIQVINNRTEAVIEGNARVYAGSVEDAAGEPQGVSVSAATDIFDLGVVVAGGKASSFGFSGAFTFNWIHNITHAHINSGALIDSLGGVVVDAADELTLISITGGIVAGANTGVGIAAAANVIIRDTQAYIGALYPAAAGSAGTYIEAHDAPIRVSASAGGSLWTVALAGAFSGQAPAKKAVVQDPAANDAIVAGDEWLTPPAQQPGGGQPRNQSRNPDVAVGVAGDLSVNVVTDDTLAYINDTGTFLTTDAVEVSSSNSSALWSLAGGVAIAQGGKDSKGVAGSISANWASGNTKAFIQGSATTRTTLQAGSLSVTASRSGGIRSLTASGSGTSLSAGEGTAFAGSFSANVLVSDTEAYLLYVHATLAGDATLQAQDECQVWAFGGAVGIGGKAGWGVGVAVNVMGAEFAPNLTRAYVQGSQITITDGTLQVLAYNQNTSSEARIIAASASVGVASGAQGTGVAVNISVNFLNYETSAYIQSSTIAEGTGTLNTIVKALDTSQITVITGAIAGSQATAVGAAIAYNEISSSILAYLDGVTLNTGGSLSLEAKADQTILSITLGVAVSTGTGGLAGAGSLSINVISSVVKAYITSLSQVTTSGAISLLAQDESLLISISGGLGFSGRAAVGAALSYNLISNTLAAYIDNSAVESTAAAVSLQAISAPMLIAVAIGGAGANTFAFGGSVTVNSIANSLDARISGGADVDAGTNLVMAAKESATMVVVSGAGAVSTTGAGIGAALAYNYVGGSFDPANPGVINRSSTTANQIRVTIDNSNAHAGGSLSMSAGFESTVSTPLPASISLGADLGTLTLPAPVTTQMTTITVGGAGASTYSLGAAVSLNFVRTSVDVSILNIGTGKKVDAVGVLDLRAADTSNLTSIAGGLGFAGTASVGAAVSYNEIRNSLTTRIENSAGEVTGNEIHLTTVAQSNLNNWTVGGAGAGTFALGGAYASNNIANTLNALVKTSGNVHATHGILLIAKDTSSIWAAAGGIAGSSSAAVGAAVSTNTITNTVRAAVEGSTVSAATVELKAELASTVEAFTVGGAGAGTFALGGSISTSNITSTVDAHISALASVTATGLVRVSAVDSATIRTRAGGLAGAGTAAVGAALATTNIANTVSAYVDNSTVSGTTVSISASQTAIIDAITVGGAGAGTFALGGSVSVNNSHSTIDAHISNHAVVTAASVNPATATSVDVTAGSTPTILSKAGGFGFAGVAAIGAAVATNNIADMVKAWVNASTLSGKELTISASLTAYIEAITVGGAGAGTFALGGSVAVNSIGSTVDAHVTNSGGVYGLSGSESVEVSATDSSHIKAISGNFAISGGVSIGAAWSTNIIQNTILAYVSGSRITGGSITISASATPWIEAYSAGGDLALYFAAGGSVADNRLGSTVKAYVDGSSILVTDAASDVEVTATDDPTVTSWAGGVNAAAGVAIGVSISSNSIANTVMAYVDTGANSRLETRLLTIEAKSTPTIDSNAVSGVVAAANAAGSVTRATIASTIQAWLLNITAFYVLQDIVIKASSGVTLTALAGVGNLGLVGLGWSTDETRLDNTVLAKIGAGSQVNAGRDISLSASATSDVGTNAGNIGAGVVNFAMASAYIHNTDEADAVIGTGAQVNAGRAITVSANQDIDSTAYAGIYAVTAVDFLTTRATIDTSIHARVNVNGALKARTITLEANVVHLHTYAEAYSGTFALIYSGVESHTRNTTHSTAEVLLGADANLGGSSSVLLKAAHGYLSTNVKSTSDPVGAIASLVVETVTDQTTHTLVTTLAGSRITTLSLVVRADVPYLPLFNTTAIQDDALIPSGSSPLDSKKLTLERIIDFNSTITVLGLASPLLVIGPDGVVEDQVNVTFTQDALNILVGNINFNTFAGSILFSIAASYYDSQPVTSTNLPRAELKGSPVIDVSRTLESVTLINESIRNLVIQDVRVTNTNPSLAAGITISLPPGGIQSAYLPTIHTTPVSLPTLVIIQNADDPLARRDPSSIELRGRIENSAGTTRISTDQGDIWTANALALVESRQLDLVTGSGSIGSAALPIHTDVSAGGLNAAASGNIYLSQGGHDLLVGRISSSDGDVDLSASGSILDLNDDAGVDVSGGIVRIASTGGSTGTPGSCLEVDGRVSLTAGAGICVNTPAVLPALPGSLPAGGMPAMLPLGVPDGNTAGDLVILNAVAYGGSIFLQADDDLFLPEGALILASGQIHIIALGSTNGAVISLLGTLTAPTILIEGGDGDDELLVNKLPAGSQLDVLTHAGADTIHLGDWLERFDGGMNIDGGTQDDLLWLDDSANLIDSSGTLTNSTVTGFGMAAGVNYTGIENLQIDLGHGSDTLTLAGSPSGSTLLNGGDGQDAFLVGDAFHRVGDLAGHVEINGQAGTDALVVDDAGNTLARSVILTDASLAGLGASLAYGTLESLTILLGTGADAVVVESTAPGMQTVLETGSGSDLVMVGPQLENVPVNYDHLGLSGDLLLRGGTGVGDLLVIRTDSQSDFTLAPAGGGSRLTDPNMGGTITFEQVAQLQVHQSDSQSDRFTVVDTSSEVVLIGNGGDDTFIVEDSSHRVWVVPGDGDDTITVLEAHARLDVDGSGGGSDTLVVDRSAATAAVTSGLLEDNAGVSAAGILLSVTHSPITFNDVETFELKLGTGNDDLTLDTALLNTTALEVDGGGGDDTITLISISPDSATTLRGRGGNDVVNLYIPGVPEAGKFIRLQMEVETLLVDNRDNTGTAVAWVHRDDPGAGRVLEVQGVPQPGVLLSTSGAGRTHILGGTQLDTLTVSTQTLSNVQGTIDGNLVDLTAGLAVLQPEGSAAYIYYEHAITFDGLTAGPASAYSEDGFTLGGAFTGIDPLSPSVQGSAAPFSLALAPGNSGGFRLYSLLLTNTSALDLTIQFTGLTLNGQTVLQSFTVPAGARLTVKLNNAFAALSSVEWSSSPALVVDDIAVEKILSTSSGTPADVPDEFEIISDVHFNTTNPASTSGTVRVNGLTRNITNYYSSTQSTTTIARFIFEGNLTIHSGVVIDAVGTHGLSIVVNNDVTVESGVTFDLSADGTTGGAGGGSGGGSGTSGTPGSNTTLVYGGDGGDPGAGGGYSCSWGICTTYGGYGGEDGRDGNGFTSGAIGGDGGNGGSGGSGINSGSGGAGGTQDIAISWGGGGGSGGTWGAGGSGGNPGDNFTPAGNGGRGVDGVDGGTGSVGTPGGSGSNGAAGGNNVSTDVLSGGGGGGAGAGGDAGGNGGSGGAGGGGGGGGGGGAGLGWTSGLTGGNGGKGGTGGLGGKGGNGGSGGAGGAGGGGGGAFELVALGRLTILGTLANPVSFHALGADGGAGLNGNPGASGSASTSTDGDRAGAGGAAGETQLLLYAGNGGNGGSGGVGGTGGSGGAGGSGGDGAGGAGGTIRLEGAILEINGTQFHVSGGQGGDSASDGGNGRVLIVSSNIISGTYDCSAGTCYNDAGDWFSLDTAEDAEYFIPQRLSNIHASGAQTPTIAGIAGGAALSGELAGLTNSASLRAALGIDLAADPNALVAVVRLDTLTVGTLDDDYAGFDALLFINLTGTALPAPCIAAGVNPVCANLAGMLNPNAVWVTLVPESYVQVSSGMGSLVPALTSTFLNGEVGSIAPVQVSTLGARPVPGLDDVVVHPAVERLYGLNSNRGVLVVVDTQTLAQRQAVFLPGLAGSSSLAVSPDGTHLYITNPVTGQVFLFDLSASGDLAALDAQNNATYTAAVNEPGAAAVVVSAGGDVYVASSLGVAKFSADLLTESIPTLNPGGPGGFDDLAMDGGSGSVFTVSRTDGTLLMLDPNLTRLGEAGGLAGASAVAVNAGFVYVINQGGNSLTMFQQVGNSLVQLQVLNVFTDGISGMLSPSDVAVSPDGRFVFVTGRDANALVVFERYTDAESGLEALRFVQVLRNHVGGVTGLQRPAALFVTATQVYAGSLGQGNVQGSAVQFTNLAASGTPPQPVHLVTSFEGIENLAVSTASGSDTIAILNAPGSEVTDLTLDTGGGPDTVVLQGASPRTVVNLGGGEDTLSYQSDDSSCVVTVDAGAGIDLVSVERLGDWTSLEISGGSENDTVQVMAAQIPLHASVTAHGLTHIEGDTLRFNPEGIGYTHVGNVFQVTGKGTLTYDTFENILKIDAPQITLVGIPPQITEGGAVTMQVAVDPQGDPAVLVGDVLWDLNGDNAFGDAVGTSVTLSWDQLRALGIDDNGTYQISVSATNASGYSSTLLITLTVVNAAPVLTVIPAGQPTVFTPFRLDLGYADPGDDHLLYWQVDWGDGNVLTYGSGTTSVLHTYALPGAMSIQVSAVDEDGTTHAGALGVTVWVDASGVNAGGPYAIAEGDALALHASAVGTPTAYSWDINGDGIFGDAFGSDPLLTWGSLQALAANAITDEGTYHVRVRVTYAGIPSADSNPVALVVSNRAPTGALTDNGPVSEGGAALVSFTGVYEPSDADRPGLIYSFDFNGDGIFDQVGASPSASVPAQYLADDGTLTVLGSIQDPDGGSFYATTTLTVLNVLPTLLVSGDAQVTEGGSYQLHLGASDPGTDAILYWQINWGDGGIDTLPGGTTLALHTYPDNGSASIVVTAVDDDGVYQVPALVVTINNVAPTLQGVSVADAFEGAHALLTGGILDSGRLDTFTLVVNWGDGSPVETWTLGAGSASFAVSHIYVEDDPFGPGPGNYPITVSLEDDDLGRTTANTTAVIWNSAPVIDAVGLSADPIYENGTAVLSGIFTDAGVLDRHTLLVDWGDGTTSSLLLAEGTRTFLVAHQYLDDDPSGTPSDLLMITAWLTDSDGSLDSAQVPVTIVNLDPTAVDINLGPGISETGMVRLNGRVTDVGSLDTLTVMVDWGDGTTSPVTLDPLTHAFNINHHYSGAAFAAGIRHGFLITITMLDDDLGSGLYLIPIQPERLPKEVLLPWNVRIINVVSGQQAGITCADCDALILRLPGGDQVTFGSGSGTLASLTRLPADGLPDPLPAGAGMVNAMQVQVWNGTTGLGQTDAPFKVSFVIPSWLTDLDFDILFWDESASAGAGAWVEVPSFRTHTRRWSGWVDRQEAWVNRTGLYVLTVRGITASLSCTGALTLELPNGDRLVVQCGSGEEARLAPELRWNLPELPQGETFLSALTASLVPGGVPPAGAMTLSFAIPSQAEGSSLALRRLEAGGWIEVPGASLLDGRIQAEDILPGTYALVSLPAVREPGCTTGTAELHLGADTLRLSCHDAGALLFWNESEATLPALIPFDTRFVRAITVRSAGAFDLLVSTQGVAHPVLYRFESGTWVEVTAAGDPSDSLTLENPGSGTWILVGVE